jgi:hypothetical protein
MVRVTNTHTTEDGITVTVHRWGFKPGFYAEAKDASGKRLAFTGVYRGKGSRQKCIDAALTEARGGKIASGNMMPA